MPIWFEPLSQKAQTPSSSSPNKRSDLTSLLCGGGHLPGHHLVWEGQCVTSRDWGWQQMSKGNEHYECVGERCWWLKTLERPCFFARSIFNDCNILLIFQGDILGHWFYFEIVFVWVLVWTANLANFGTLANLCFCVLWESSPWLDLVGLELALTGHAFPVSSDWALRGILVRLTPFCLRVKRFQLLEPKAGDYVASDKRIQMVSCWDFEVCLMRHFEKMCMLFHSFLWIAQV